MHLEHACWKLGQVAEWYVVGSGLVAMREGLREVLDESASIVISKPHFSDCTSDTEEEGAGLHAGQLSVEAAILERASGVVAGS